jgi:hypothetical protein
MESKISIYKDDDGKVKIKIKKGNRSTKFTKEQFDLITDNIDKITEALRTQNIEGSEGSEDYKNPLDRSQDLYTLELSPGIDCVYNRELPQIDHKSVIRYNKEDDGTLDHAEIHDPYNGNGYRNEGLAFMVQYLSKDNDGNKVIKRRLCYFCFRYDDYGSAIPVKGFEVENDYISHNDITWIPATKGLDEENISDTDIKDKLKNVFCLKAEEYHECEDDHNVSFVYEYLDQLYIVHYDLPTKKVKDVEHISDYKSPEPKYLFNKLNNDQ